MNVRDNQPGAPLRLVKGDTQRIWEENRDVVKLDCRRIRKIVARSELCLRETIVRPLLNELPHRGDPRRRDNSDLCVGATHLDRAGRLARLSQRHPASCSSESEFGMAFKSSAETLDGR